ncbi:MAG: glycine betaine ABC transporter substrate-binding protein [Rhodoglobus sp.]
MKKSITTLAAGAVMALALAGCSATEAPESTSPDGGDKKELTIAVFNGWDEGVAASELWRAILEEKGYDVTFESADAGPVFLGISQGEYDLTLDGWLPITHAEYMEKFGDDIEDLGAWNEDAKLTIAVNEDAPIDSLDELAANADLFGNRIVGIEAGAGLTGVVEDAAIPGYGLDGMDFLVSSTPAMLAELQAATDAGENIAVTLWRPHWAYDAYPIKDLEDPKGLMGDQEGIHTFARDGFADDFPELNGWLNGWSMDSEKLYSLENALFNDPATDDLEAITADWIAENQDWVDSLTK